MVTSVKISNSDYARVLSWLQENIGDLVHSQPIIFWHGRGWHMKMGRDVAPSRLAIGKNFITVEFDNPEHATWFGLVWL
jgi:hypothetical protein